MLGHVSPCPQKARRYRRLHGDARIGPIYEGTNGIQANDLVFRKTVRDNGAATKAFVEDARGLASELESSQDTDLLHIRGRMLEGLDTLDTAAAWVVETGASNKDAVAAASSLYLRLFGTVAGGVMLARCAAKAKAKIDAGTDSTFLRGKINTARFYADQILPTASGLLIPVMEGHTVVLEIDEEQL